MDVGDIVKSKRKAMHLTQIELAEKSGVNQGQISRIESGESNNITLDNLRGLALALECAVTDLLSERDKTPRKGKAA